MFNQQFKHLLFEFYRRFILQKYPDLGVSGKSDSNPQGSVRVLTSVPGLLALPVTLHSHKEVQDQSKPGLN